MSSSILIVWTPESQFGDGRAFRDYVLESLQTGVLVLPSEVTCEVLELPSLGGVAVAPAAPLPAQAAQGEPAPTPPAAPTGRNAAEKRAILARMKAYREKHGLGCWDAVVQASGGKLSADQLRDLYAGACGLSLAQWRLADKALDRLEKQTAAV